eukprot:a1887_57.p1 GENE.a1887_57~~a1887_57.p1  ORF type:complete len:410 (-),score=162.80 a1887_57:18-1220(-)
MSAIPTTNSYMVCGTRFDIDSNYSLIKPIGQGAYGVVCAAKRVDTGDKVAIKKIGKVFEQVTEAKRTLREVKILRHLQHENIIALKELMRPSNVEEFEDLYIVTELLDTDLHQIISSPQPLSEDHAQYFVYQILRGLKFIHSAHVIHRDLKPSNILLNSNCDLKICDLGLARVAEPEQNHAGFMTEYVATRWYRAPEVMLSWAEYTKAMDIWSVGCIFAEMFSRRPIFPGRDFLHQLQLIVAFLGSPLDEDIAAIKSERARKYMLSLPRKAPVDLSRVFPRATPEAIDFMCGLLAFNPDRRMTVEQALAHPFMADIHDPEDEPVCHERFEFSFERMELNSSIVRRLLIEEALSYHPHGPELLAQLDEYHAAEAASAAVAAGHGYATDDTEEAVGGDAMEM